MTTTQTWVYVSIAAAQRLLGVSDVASAIEVKVDDIYQAKAIGQRIIDRVGDNLEFTDWMTMNQSIFQALRLERLVMFITIGLIVLVAALNIVATLIMMVLEKTRDIAILMSMGATQRQYPADFHPSGCRYRRDWNGLSESSLARSCVISRTNIT